MNKLASFAEPESFKVRFTADEFIRLLFSDVFEDARLELIDGELFHMSPPSGGHATKQAAVIGSLWVIAREAGLHVLGEVAIQVAIDAVLVCDAALVRRLPEQRSPMSPTDIVLVVEVSETTAFRNLGYKRRVYAEAGIATYWVIDAAAGVIHRFSSPSGGVYTDQEQVGFGQPLAVPGTGTTITIE